MTETTPTAASPTRTTEEVAPEVAAVQDAPNLTEGSGASQVSKNSNDFKEATEESKASKTSTNMKSPSSTEKAAQKLPEEKKQKELNRDIRKIERKVTRGALILGTLACLVLAVHKTVSVVRAEYPLIYDAVTEVHMEPVSECERTRNEARDWISSALVRQSYYYIFYYLLESLMAACLLLVLWLPDSDPGYIADDDDLKNPIKVLRRADFHIFTSLQRVGAYLLHQSVFVMALSVYVYDRLWEYKGPLLFFDFGFQLLWASKLVLLVLYVAIHFNREFVDEKKGSRTILQTVISWGKYDPVQDDKKLMDLYNKEKKKKTADTSEAAKKQVEVRTKLSLEEKPKAEVELKKSVVDKAIGPGNEEPGPLSPAVSDQIFKVAGTDAEMKLPDCQTPD